MSLSQHSSRRAAGDTALSVRGLSKCYTLAHNAPKHTLATDALLHRLKTLGKASQTETFWALQDVSFEIAKGDVVGIIGRNGAGKSTLLKILSRITEPTSGQIDLYGRVGSLLEVGTGFHQELTGRENIFLNGAILGMGKREIASHFDAIVDFAGVDNFLDTPVKRYSSGMYVRLAFAVAAHLEPEILIVDEVLAVGDAEFQKKCLGKMQDVASQGRTVLFVSHSMAAVRALCHTGIVLQGGRVLYSGPAAECINHYMGGAATGQDDILSHLLPPAPGVSVLAIRVNGSPSDRLDITNHARTLTVEIEGTLAAPQKMEMEADVTDLFDMRLGFFSPGHERGYARVFPAGPFRITRTIELPDRITRGEYFVNIYLTEPDVRKLAEAPHALRLAAEGTPTRTGRALEYGAGAGWISLGEPAGAADDADDLLLTGRA